MSKKTANETLKNVFEACNRTPNSVSLETLILKNFIKHTFAKVCTAVSYLILILIILSPLAFIQTDFIVNNNLSASIAIVDHELYKDKFIMIVSGDDILEDKIYAKLEDTTLIYPEEVIANENGSIKIVFPYKNEALSIYIPTVSGETAKAVLSKH